MCVRLSSCACARAFKFDNFLYNSLILYTTRNKPRYKKMTKKYNNHVNAIKCFGCTTIHNKALYKCIINSFNVFVQKVRCSSCEAEDEALRS